MKSDTPDTGAHRAEPRPEDSRFLATHTYRKLRYEWVRRTWFGRLLLADDAALVLVAFVTLPLEFLMFDVVFPAVDDAAPAMREISRKLPNRYKDERRPRNDK